MKTKILFLCLLCSWFFCKGQAPPEPTELTIFECYTLATEAYPLIKNRINYDQESELKLKNIGTGYLPNIMFDAEGKYLSEVINLNNVLPVPGYDIPSPPNDQFNFAISLNQLIYDGGRIKGLKAVEESRNLTNKQAIEVELHHLKGRVNFVFFRILFMQYNERILMLAVKELNERLIIGRSAVNNGIMLQSDLDILQAEKIRLEQNIIENKFNIQKNLGVLGAMIDSILPQETLLIKPEIILDFEKPLTRPEVVLISYQKDQLELNKKLLSSRRYPRISGFGQLGYGQPGLNPVNNGFDGYYILGLRLSWKILDWNQTKRDKEVLGLGQSRLDHQLEAFKQNVTIELDKEVEDINKFKTMILKDKELIELRERIIKSTTSKLENGVLQAADYVRDFNQFLIAQVQEHIHELFLLQAKFNYLTTKGNTIGNENN